MNKQVANVQLMQQMNRLKVLDFVRHNPDVTRPFISEKTGLSLASITNITSYLLELGLLCESGIEKVGRVGRKSVLLRFCASKYNLICIYLNEKYINIALTDLLGNVKNKIKVDICELSVENTIAEMKNNVMTLIKQYKNNKILGIGVAISGLILDDNRFLFSSSLKWKAFDIKNCLEEITSLPVFVDNISLIKAVWYFLKNYRNAKQNMLFVDMDNGIGAVQYCEGSILRSTLGEIGHTTVESGGELCFCGNRGCLEAMCNVERLLSLYKKASGKSISSISELEKLYKNNDKNAIYAIEECGKYLGIGLANLVNVFYPAVIVINPQDFENCPSLIKVAEEQMYKRAYPNLTEKLILKRTNETEENILYGTAFNLCNRLFDISYKDNIVK